MGLELETCWPVHQISLLVIYYLTKFDGVIQSGFGVISNITPANLWKPIHEIINYSISICPFESGKCGKEEQKLQKFEYLENEKSFLDETKNIFHSFSRAITWWKNKNLKNTSFKLFLQQYRLTEFLLRLLTLILLSLLTLILGPDETHIHERASTRLVREFFLEMFVRIDRSILLFPPKPDSSGVSSPQSLLLAINFPEWINNLCSAGVILFHGPDKILLVIIGNSSTGYSYNCG